MEREEPSACLVHALGNEVGRIDRAVVQQLLVFKWIMNLGVGHSSRIKPDIDEVQFACEHSTARAHQFDIIHVGAVEVNAVVVPLAHVAHHETLLLQRIASHHASVHSLFDFVVEFLHAADADFLAGVAVAPNGQGRAPIARA